MNKFLRAFGTTILALSLFGIGALIASYACARPTILDVAQYAEEYNSVVDWEDTTFQLFLLEAVQDKPIGDLIDELGLPHKPKNIQSARYYNTALNVLIDYNLNKFNLWRAQRAEETTVLRTGDCKASAVLKYHLLKQLGYTNVKIITVTIMDGAGGQAGHAVTLLNDQWILDINYPYFYPFAILRGEAVIRESFDETGVKRLKHYGE